MLMPKRDRISVSWIVVLALLSATLVILVRAAVIANVQF